MWMDSGMDSPLQGVHVSLLFINKLTCHVVVQCFSCDKPFAELDVVPYFCFLHIFTA